MQKTSREKIALVVFVALAVLSLCGLGAYIFAGHSWNIAATSLDDTLGEMEGYTAIMFSPSAASGAEGASDKGGGSAAEGSDGVSGAGKEGGSASDAAKASNASEDGSASNAGEDGSSAAAAGGSSAARDDGSPFRSLASSAGSAASKVDLDKLRQTYEDNGAAVLVLDVDSLAAYREGSILKRGDRRIGVMSVDDSVTQLDVVSTMRQFAEAEVDFTVVVTPDKWKVQRLGGIDIVICTDDEGLPAMGQTENDTFFVDSPSAGHAGVILISPSNVVSAKVVSES